MPAINNRLLLFCLIASCLFVSLFASCSGNEPGTAESSTTDSLVTAARPVDEDSTLVELSRRVLGLLREKNYGELAPYFHPEDGVRFSPYGYVDTVHDVVLTKEQFIQHLNSKDSTRIHWGSYDGSGDSIYLAVSAYFNKFVYDVDFLHAEKSSLDSIIGLGNSLNNLKTVYKGDRFTESHFSGFDKKYEGMDWRSLRLVYRRKNDSFYLVGMVHDQWTS